MQIFISKSRFKKVLHCGCLYKCQYTEQWLSKRFPPVQKFWILESFPATSLQRINFPWAVCNSPQIGLLSKIPSHPLPPPSPPPPPKERGKGGGGGGDGGGGGRPWNVFQQVWTCFNRFERVSTGSNGGVPRWGWGLVWLIHQTACSFLMISPKLYAIWPILFSILLQYFLVVLLILFATLGVG